ncbi:putative sulfite reductase [NADPH] flavo protein component [Metschnikowia bicuspidata var. bicuspidata NRRL YB-4993]|uniref:assimilatory sulfite reductase (NADPH) n=1 Tax=Metschnikowia bicuspidata var. bicuspidata NRRL YB-4993 TaxID=869754 RepID=A0A1A0HED2_9ASCO|nr:putative sulfite reductase [NADPH] flavo protein component [Metschnikowia bicuspidata var. bicuspidata NRRL YB-4993]OBA22345.1 putative sulfite reductase [NADPH] flavo protein component [Metschnikowia bicuspidata var. bicuspidata NRRL YB-4993]
MSPHAASSSGEKTPSANSAIDAQLAHIVKANPFGISADPHVLKNSVYSSAATVISQTVYALADSIFSYETPGAGNLADAHLLLWATTFKRLNALGAVPLFHRLEPRLGAANAIFGFASQASGSQAPFTAVLGASALSYMQPALASSKPAPLSLNVSAIDYDTTAGALVSNYAGPVAVARKLGLPVVSPVSYEATDLQYSVVLNHFLAALTGAPSVHLFDGPEFARTFQHFDSVLSVADIGRLYEQLLGSGAAKPANVDHALEVAFDTFNAVAGTSIAPFEYEGHAEPETVFVVHGAHEATQVSALVAKAKTSATTRVGVVKVRVPFPFAQHKFAAAIPASTRKVVVLLPELSAALKADATAALFLTGRFAGLLVDEFAYPATFVWSPVSVYMTLGAFVPELEHAVVLGSSTSSNAISAENVTAFTSPEGSYMFWTRDNSDLAATADKLALSLSLDSSKRVSIRNKFDTSVSGGVFQSLIVSRAKDSVASSVVDAADVVLIESASILNHFDVLATAKPGATVLLVNEKKITNSVEADVVEKLPATFRSALATSHLKLVVVDFSIVEELDAVSDSTKGFSADFLAQVGFWRASFPELGSFVINKLLQGNGNDFELLAAVLDKFVATVDEKLGLKAVNVLPEWIDLKNEAEKEEAEKKEDEEEKEEIEEIMLPFFPTETSFFPNSRTEPPSTEESFHLGTSDVATKLAFPEAYGVTRELRPDLPVKNFVVKVQENKRLTPNEYSRNIFHIEFDVTGTGLTYDIGEALGIHGRNNSTEVEKFLEFYGVDGDTLIEVSNKDDPTLLEIRSARQALADNVDFLGKPPKRFYESLAPFAADENEKAALEKLASSAGAEELKKRQDVDFDSYVDILDEFKSARPSFDALVKIIAPLKRREYSIASSQKMHPNAVHLLIVVVDWVDSRGRTRYGHCSKYLSDLSIGDELVVSVKPSVMKLPKLPEQPIVMSGLGTGLAPFKAFIEEKIWQQAQGQTIGEIYLYMGSRHKKEEYLYGELWEAYKAAGILTHIGAAFSRDQPEKIYIQDKIRGSIEELTDAIVTKNGSFYLCGPTWPVPDITACLEDIVQNGAKRQGTEISDVAKVVEDMKEDGRYILEVY